MKEVLFLSNILRVSIIMIDATHSPVPPPTPPTQGNEPVLEGTRRTKKPPEITLAVTLTLT